MSIPPDWLILTFDRRVFAPPSRRSFYAQKEEPPKGFYISQLNGIGEFVTLTKRNNRDFNQEVVSLLLYNFPNPMLLHIYYIKIIRNSKAYDLTSNDEKRTRPASKYFLTLRTSIVDRPKRTVFSEWFSVLIA